MSRIYIYINQYSILFGCMHSTLGHNVQYCFERYSALSHSTLCSHTVIQRACYKRYTRDDYVWTLFNMELMMLRRGILTAYQINMHQITDVINYVCSSNF